MIVVLDNQDSFVYNLVAQLEDLGHEVKVFRNSVDPDVIFAENPDLICLSPGPGTPRDAGHMMQVIDRALGKIPLLGICLGFQALIEHAGGHVTPVGAVHGVSQPVILTYEGAADPIFSPLGDRPADLSVARYHSLGTRQVPDQMVSLAHIDDIVMAARWRDQPALGFQFHPESLLTTRGTDITRRAVEDLIGTKAVA